MVITKILLNITNFKNVVDFSSSSASWLSHLTSPQNLQIHIEKVFPLLRKFVQCTRIKNPCLLLSLSSFAISPKGSYLLISTLDLKNSFEAHAWIQLQNGVILTTDQHRISENAFTFKK